MIDSLPGQPSGVNFNQYSGYIVTDKSRGRALFYYFAEAQTEDRFSKPLTLWLGGESNMLYVDSPIVAFSYSNTTSDYKIWSDTMTARENMKFLRKWFIQYSEYRNQDFYIAGDSYGGHLAPQLAALILKYNRKPEHIRPIKLKGIVLGNPLLEKMSLSNIEHLWYHGIISTELYHLQKKECNATRMVNELLNGELSEYCSDIDVMISEEIGDDTDQENLLSQSCEFSSISSSQQHYLATETAEPDPCLRDWIDKYINMPEVQKALHANTTDLQNPWKSTLHGNRNTMLHNLAIDILPTLSKLLKKDIKVLIYRILVSVLARRLKLTTLEMNGPWYDGKQIGGWSQTYGKLGGCKKVGNLTFATVRGGAHFVPSSSPSEAHTLFKSFIKGTPLPKTDPNY
nr:serine carboxypeptidase-like 45 [Ipomoea batatas]